MPNTLRVYQHDPAGHFVSFADADESPLEPGVYILPRGCVRPAPPDEWPANLWPRWNGAAWELVPRPRPAVASSEPLTPAQKLAEFLRNNPDVQQMLG
jgi:hypothetical protein